MKRFLPWVVTLALALALGLSGCDRLEISESAEEPPGQEAQARIENMFFYNNSLYRAETGELVRYSPDLAGREVLAQGCDRVLEVSGKGIWFTGNANLYKLEPGGAEPRLLAENAGYDGRITNRWIYVQTGESKQLFRYSKEDGRAEQVGSGAYWIVAMCSDRVYFEEKEALYELTDSQTTPTLILNCSLYSISVYKDTAYLSVYGHYSFDEETNTYSYAQVRTDEGCIFRLDIPKGTLHKLEEEKGYSHTAAKEGLFYQDGMGLLKWIPPNADRAETLSDTLVSGVGFVTSSGFVVRDGWVYCCGGEESNWLMRINLQSKKAETLTDVKIEKAWFYGDQIYYQGMERQSSGCVSVVNMHPLVYRMNLDGSGRQKVAEFEEENLINVWVKPPFVYTAYAVPKQNGGSGYEIKAYPIEN